MSRDAYERVVERVVKDPQLKMTEERARRDVAKAAERCDRIYGPPAKPISPEEHDRRANAVRPNFIRGRAPVDKDSKLHYDLSHADGTAPPRAAFHERVTSEDRKEIGEFGRMMEERARRMLTRG